MRRTPFRLLAVASLLSLALAACGPGEQTSASAGTGSGGAAETTEPPRIVVTTSILGDVVSEIAGDSADVETIMPAGSDPHDFEASARQIASIEDADLVVANGSDLEQSLLDPLQNAEDAGIPVFHATDQFETIQFGAFGERHEHGSVDPHFWQDPTRMAQVVRALGTELDGLTGGTEMSAATEEYASSLDDLDEDVEALVHEVPEARRLLVTNHDAFGYFADRYGYEIVGTVIPSGSSNAAPSAKELAELADAIRATGVPAIFAESTVEPRTAEALAAEVGKDIAVAKLYSDSLAQDGSGAETYVGMIHTNAETISSALAP